MKKDSTKILWRVEVFMRGQWRLYSTYETRADARSMRTRLRGRHYMNGRRHPGYGFGNTRVVRVERGGK